jgi:hypothetical protein
MSNIKVQSSNKAQNPNEGKFPSFHRLSLIELLDFGI